MNNKHSIFTNKQSIIPNGRSASKLQNWITEEDATKLKYEYEHCLKFRGIASGVGVLFEGWAWSWASEPILPSFLSYLLEKNLQPKH